MSGLEAQGTRAYIIVKAQLSSCAKLTANFGSYCSVWVNSRIAYLVLYTEWRDEIPIVLKIFASFIVVWHGPARAGCRPGLVPRYQGFSPFNAGLTEYWHLTQPSYSVDLHCILRLKPFVDSTAESCCRGAALLCSYKHTGHTILILCCHLIRTWARLYITPEYILASWYAVAAYSRTWVHMIRR
jgi:hypothetical protein